MSFYAAPIARLIEEFEKLPGIGHKTASDWLFMCWICPRKKLIGLQTL